MAKNKHYQQIVMNIKPDLVRNDTMMGKEYTVVPMVMMVEGVLAGNCGPIMYPFEEMSQVPQIWNSKPVVVYHPENEGTHGSACTPEELTVRSIGTIMNAKAVKDKATLNAEAWIDMERAALVDERVVTAINEKTVMELSTGLYMDVDDTPGVWNETKYIGKASNFRPDHLAVLPDVQGACSIEDGAGFIRVNMKYDTEVKNEISNNDTYSQLTNLIRENLSDDAWAWVEDVFNSYFVFERSNKLYKQDYEIESDGTTVKLVGLPTEVVRIMTYKLVENEAKGNSMDKEKVVGDIIANECTLWTEDDREALMGMNEDVLEKMIPKVIEKSEVPEKTDVQNAAEEGFKGAAAPAKVLNVKEHIATLPKEIQEVLNHGLATYNEKRNNLVTTILANERNTFAADYLKTKDIKELQAIANLCEPVETVDTRFDYGLQAPVVSNQVCDEEPLALPSTSTPE